MIPEDTIADAEAAAARIMRALSGNSSARSDIHVNAGGVGVWVAASACAAMLVGMIVGGIIGGLWLHREFTSIDADLIAIRDRAQAQQGYLNAIYRAAPQLQPVEQKTQPEKK